MKPIKLAIIGLGSAGIQSICHFLSYLNKDSEVWSIYDPNIKILGIGESTNPSFTTMLELGTDFDIMRDLNELDATYKLGTYYINWRKQEFLNPLLSGSLAIHFNNFKLKDYAIPRLKDKWREKFKVLEGKVDFINNNINNVEIYINNKVYSFDFLIDCRGFPESYNDYHVFDDAPVNSALVHNIYGVSKSWNYTVHKATKDGWMFEVPLSSRHSYGYLYNKNITSVEQARINFSKEIGVELTDLENIEYNFKSYYTKNLIENRIIKNGNRSVFFEPMFANSLWLYDQVNRIAWDYINQKVDQDLGNYHFVDCCVMVHDMIHFHYHGGSIFNSDFWQEIPKISVGA
jgi:tryptophan halogenase